MKSVAPPHSPQAPEANGPSTPDEKGKPDAKDKPKATNDLKTLPFAEVEKRLQSSPDGLTESEASSPRSDYSTWLCRCFISITRASKSSCT